MNVADLEHGRGHCHDCGHYPAFVPRVLVANLEAGTSDRYFLQLPHLCDTCVAKRGLTRYGFLSPKTREYQGPTEILAEHLAKLPAWIEKVQAKGIQDLMDQGMSEEDARGMLGVS